MLRRTIYVVGQFEPFMLIALGFSLLIAVGFVAFLINVLGTLGLRATLSLVLPDKLLGMDSAPAEA